MRNLEGRSRAPDRPGDRTRARGRSTTAGSAALLLLLGLLAGCFTYAPPETGAPPTPGTSVRVELTSVGVDRLQERVGRTHRTLEGPLVDETGDSLWVDMVVRGYETASGARYRDTVSVPRGDVRDLRVRTFSAERTALVGALGVGAGVAAVLFLDLGGGGSPGGDDGGEVFSRIPLIRLVH